MTEDLVLPREWAPPDTPWDRIADDGTLLPEAGVPAVLPAEVPAESPKRKRRRKGKPGELEDLIGKPRFPTPDPVPALNRFSQAYFDELAVRNGWKDWTTMCVGTGQHPDRAKVRHVLAILQTREAEA